MNSDALAARGADIILRSFDEVHARFRAITRRAKERFEKRDWEGIRLDTVSRLDLHGRRVSETLEALRGHLREGMESRALWAEMKLAFSDSILGLDDFELAQTFFNSLSRRQFPHVGVDPAIDYVSGDFPLPYKGWEMASARLYAADRIEGRVVAKILKDADLRVPFPHLEEDSRRAAERLEAAVVRAWRSPAIDALDVVRPVMVRNKAAYVVGRIRRGAAVMPMIFALLHEPQGLVLDAVLDTEEQASILFSFAHWYFHAEVRSPREVIGFLHSILPKKRISELYISLGFNKHGKSEFYADLTATIGQSHERFIVAPGQRGLVMCVFTLPSFPFVFKIIKDRFPPSKKTSRSEVMARYRQVLSHDRVGRLVDFQEYEDLEFSRDRFAPGLLRELLHEAGQTVHLAGDAVRLDHLYVGRRVRPLDLYLQEAGEAAAAAAVLDWGQAIKDLATANIFAGDMLLKNFGVTRHGRVVFYDYDEICPLVDCTFRAFPPARDSWDDLAPEPWYSVGDHDTFPEELRRFVKLPPPLWHLFEEHHGELFEVDFWKDLQERHRQGEIIDFFPYGSEQRLPWLVSAKA